MARFYLSRARPIIRRTIILLVPAIIIFVLFKSLWTLAFPTKQPLPPLVPQLEIEHSTSKAESVEELLDSLSNFGWASDAINHSLVYQVPDKDAEWRFVKNTERRFKASDQENQYVFPSAPVRPKIYTYTELSFQQSVSDPEATEQKLKFNLENEILETWKRAFYAMGFDPVVLQLSDALKHPKFSTYIEVSDKEKKFKRMKHAKWFALASIGSGAFSDYRVIPVTRTFNTTTFNILRHTHIPKSFKFIDSDSIPIAITSASTTEKIIQLILESEDSDDKSLQSRIAGEFQLYPGGNQNDIAYYSDKNIKAINLGKLDKKNIDPIYTLTLMNTHLHQIFIHSNSEGINYFDPYNIDISKKNKKSYRHPFFNKFSPKIKTSNFQYLESPAINLASRLAQCPSDIYSEYKNLCIPTSSTLDKIKNSKTSKELQYESICEPLACSSYYEKNLRKNVNLLSPVDYLPTPDKNSYTIVVLPHPATVLYFSADEADDAQSLVKKLRYYLRRNGFVNMLTGSKDNEIFKKAPNIGADYRITYLKDSMYQYSSVSKVLWIAHEVDEDFFDKFIQYELGFRLLKVSHGKEKGFVSYSGLLKLSKQHMKPYLSKIYKAASEDFYNLMKLDSNSNSKSSSWTAKLLTKILPSSNSKEEQITKERRLVDAANLWSFADYEIWTFLRRMIFLKWGGF